MEMLTHDIIVSLSALFALAPDQWVLSLFGGELILNGDGSFITGETLSAQLYF